MRRRMIVRHTLIHRGERTHHQLQSITWQSFSTIKAIVRRPLKPIPLFETFVFSLLIFFYFLNVIIFFFFIGFEVKNLFEGIAYDFYIQKKLLVDSLNLKTIFLPKILFLSGFPKKIF